MNEKEIKVASSTPSRLVRCVTIPSTLLLTKQNERALENVLTVIEEVTGVPPHLYMAVKSRETTHVTLRQITAYCLKEYTSITLKGIGIIQGARDHSSIIHSIKVVTSWLEGAPGYGHEKKLVESIMKHYGEKCEVAV